MSCELTNGECYIKAIDLKFAVAMPLTGEQPNDWDGSKALLLAPPALPSALLIFSGM